MSATNSLKLVAYRARFGLLFSIADLVEIVAVEELVWDGTDDCGLRRCQFRGELLQIPDFSFFLGDLQGTEPGESLLVLRGQDSFFGVQVDRVGGIFAAEQFCYHDLPLVLKDSARQCYDCLAQWREHILICCDPARLEGCKKL